MCTYTHPHDVEQFPNRSEDIVEPLEGRSRVVVEGVEPQVEGGRFPVKRIIGDTVYVTAAIYGDGHDHVAAQVLYRNDTRNEWRSVRMEPLGNDLWAAHFKVDTIGNWQFHVQGWIDHFDTWAADLSKRITAQTNNTSDDKTQAWSLEQGGSPQDKSDVLLAFLTGASLLEKLASSAEGEDRSRLEEFSDSLRLLADRNSGRFENPVTEELKALASRYPDLRFATRSNNYDIRVDRTKARFSTWYEFFPRSSGENGEHGTLRHASRLIPELASRGFDVIYLPPIHPIGHAFRKGKNNTVSAQPEDVGSPWAIGSHHGGHTAIAPELGSFADFDAMVRTAYDSGVEIAMDIAFQCSPDHPWVKKHPEWFSIRPDGSIQYAENPPKKYQDIYPLNFESSDWHKLWEELCNVFLFWAERGIRIFRVDNPHTKALPFWEWCINKVQRTYPDALFLAEAFTRPHVMYGLAKRGFSQSYTYFSWRNTKAELIAYMTELTTLPVRDFFRPNLWPNTPDILPEVLQKGGRPAFMQRAILAATLGANYGIYGPPFELMEHRPIREGSEEYLNSEKYQVRSWDREHTDSLITLLATLNEARQCHSALQQNDTLHFHGVDNEQILCFSKRSEQDIVLVVVNLDNSTAQSGWTSLDTEIMGLSRDEPYQVHDILSGQTYTWTGPYNYVRLDPLVMPAHIFHLRGIGVHGSEASS